MSHPPRITGMAVASLAAATLLLVRNAGFDRSAQAQSGGVTTSQPTGAASTGTSVNPPSGTNPTALVLPAVLNADESVELYAKASGYVSKINVDIGSRVREGDVLIQLDAPEMVDDVKQSEAVDAARQARLAAMKAKAEQARLGVESALAQTKRVEAELALCRITYQRKAELYREKAIPQQEYDVAQNQQSISEADLVIAQAKAQSARGEEAAARAEIEAAEAELGVARADAARLRTLLAYTTLKAPFDGVVTRRGVDRGAFVRSAAQGTGAALLAVEKVDRLRLVIDVPETHAPLVHTGTQVQVQLRAQADRTFVAQVSRTAASLRADTRTMRAEVDLDNQSGRFLPGMYARVSIERPTQTAPGG